MLRRPKPGESDLDEMMTEFESQRSSSSAAPVNKRKFQEPEPENKKPKSVFARRREEKAGPDRKLEPKHETVNLSVLSEIVERNDCSAPVAPNLRGNYAFPEVLKLEKTDEPRVSKASLFSQQFQKMKSGFSDPEQTSKELQKNICQEPTSNRKMNVAGNNILNIEFS